MRPKTGIMVWFEELSQDKTLFQASELLCNKEYYNLPRYYYHSNPIQFL